MDKTTESDNVLAIQNALQHLGLSALMNGNKVTIADDVSKILGYQVTYEQVEQALHSYQPPRLLPAYERAVHNI